MWWDGGCSGFDLFTSLEVIDEAGEGEEEMAGMRLALLNKTTQLEITDDVGSLELALSRSG
jgi:hypothetical protein